ncbi:ABC transporter ATP-binding protein [Duganella sp. LX20W]|uniref:ABC transporter ATP-binding protein n=1 Tax=Rugamonas brunnea TaxID=2758569 RepID=A0A7W2ESX7_9BURK|nr:ATP-binding cassette domain-containing protein [Rugamonas brunnea]MBA5637925.1 ABC transporter ATP-binding protein [Rugamonas brunnea]
MAEADVVSASSSLLVEARGLGKRYGAVRAVDAVELEVRPGEIYGLIGPDGAGKSSLLKAVAGILRFDSGTLDVFGVRLDSERACERIKDRIGLMPQGLGQNLYGDLSVEENIDYFGGLRLLGGDELTKRKDSLLRSTRLDAFRDRPMKNLSGGMKQKLGLVCTLIHQPQLVILDEPTTGVDPVSRREFWAILDRLLAEHGTTALVSTAYMDEASRFHRVSMMHEGRMLASGTPERMRALSAGRIVRSGADGRQAEALERLQRSYPQAEALGRELRVFVDGDDANAALEQVEQTLDGLPHDPCEVLEPELEDVFIALLRQRGAQADAKRTPGAVTNGATSAATPTAAGRASAPATPASVPAPSLASMPAPASAPARATDATPAIEADQLTRTFGAFKAADAVSFRVPQGEIFGLLGANGAGKSTVIKMLTGILRPSDGRGRVAGADMRDAGRQIRERIGYMSQAFSLYLDLTVMENIRLYAGIYAVPPQLEAERIAWVLDMAGLHPFAGALAASLPMGLRQRLALGCALLHRPQVLFLDEPTSGVDPVGRRAFWDILFRLSREDKVTILVTTHYMSEAEHCDHIALMYAGRVVADASPEQLKAGVERDAGKLYELTTSAPQPLLDMLRAEALGQAALFGSHIHLLLPDPQAGLARLDTLLAKHGMQVDAITPRRLSMEDVFVHLVTKLEAADQARAGAATAKGAAGGDGKGAAEGGANPSAQGASA